nr:MAG TPA: minor capsid protein [Caudoviricetes sp.]
MLTPQQITELAETLYPALDDLNQWITQDMVKRLMARLGRGEAAVLSATDQWQTEVYKTAGGHLEDLKKELKKFTKQSDAEIASIFEDAAVKAWAADCAVYAASGKGVKPLALSDRMVEILQDAYTRTQGEAHNFTRTTASASQKRLFKVLDEAHFKVVTGAQSYTAAVQEAVDDLVQHQTHVIYPTGHRDTIETAVLRAVRTGISQATGNMTLQGMEELDWDIILTSAHRGARYGDGGHNPGNHFWWQGKYYSRTGRTPGLPLFVQATGFGTGEGLGGYNCRHSFGPGDLNHNPYQHFDEEENRRVYDLTQKQRAKEARIRHDKIEIAGYRAAAKNAADSELRVALGDKAAKAEARLEKHIQDYNQFCADNDLKPLNDRLYVAKRSQATAPAAAHNAATTPEAMFSSMRGSGGNTGQPGEVIHRYLGKVDPADTEQIEALKNVFCEQYASSPVENMMVITKDGEIHFMTDNNPRGVDCSYLGDKLKGSYNIHTHPPDTTQYSFSTDADIPAAFSDGTAIMEAVDCKYRYQFVVPSGITLEQWEAVCEAVQEERNSIMTARGYDFGSYEENIQHVIIDETCRRLGVKCYRREARK